MKLFKELSPYYKRMIGEKVLVERERTGMIVGTGIGGEGCLHTFTKKGDSRRTKIRGRLLVLDCW